jgi:TolB protein
MIVRLLLASILFSCLAVPCSYGAWLFGKKKAKEKEPPRVRIEPFAGGTGTSAWSALRDELMAANEIFPVTKGEEKTTFTLTGESSGGRIMARLRSDKGKEIFERTYAAPGLDENAKALADDLVLAVTGKPGLSTSQITFVSDVSGKKQIYVCDSDGKNILRLSDHAVGCVSPSMNASAGMVIFTTYRSGFPAVAVIDPVSGFDRTLTETPGGAHGAVFSPDGNRVALTLGFIGTPEIFVMNLADSSAACVTETTGVPSSATWHPDGKSIVYSCDEGDGPLLWITSMSEKSAPVRWRTGYSFCVDPEWAPDGKQIAFTARVGGSLGVVIRGYPSGSSRVLQSGGAQHPTWSPNGRFIAYVQDGKLYLHDLKNDERRQLARGFGRISEPYWMK